MDQSTSEVERLMNSVLDWYEASRGKCLASTEMTVTAKDASIKELETLVAGRSHIEGLSMTFASTRIPDIYIVRLKLQEQAVDDASNASAVAAQKSTSESPETLKRMLNLLKVGPPSSNSSSGREPTRGVLVPPARRQGLCEIIEASNLDISASSGECDPQSKRPRLSDDLDCERLLTSYAMTLSTRQEEWRQNGGMALEAASPGELTVLNSLRTSDAEASRRE
eukprot:TRINITY_DN41489_c0_g1_i1.p1 TRINITY_DN41489_c0_g1~~TRINITY_DN41489_c0_g1_i1.p1  ORF type:complete len:251 (+),score=44.31 TRINITY_DN41489_c0_g1_i1:83-754(+)